jgi:prepilin-type N-terminal cleavage/methylation domain-containing protein
MKKINKGFTLIEISLSIVLIAILISITTPLTSGIIARAELNSAHESLYNSLLRAQQLSKDNYKNSQWRVCIDNDNKQYTITAGTCSSTLYSETIKVSSSITISSEQTLDLQFTSTKGELNYGGSFVKINLSNGGFSKSVIVNKVGIIDKTSNTGSVLSTPSIVTNGLVLNLDAGNIASYPGTGNIWYDLSGKNNNGTLVNGTGYNSANGGSLVFDGVNDHILTSNILHNIGSSDFTYSLWVYPVSLKVPGATIVGFIGNGEYSPVFGFDLNGFPSQLGYYWGGWRGFGTTLQLNQWHYVVMTRQGTEIKGFVNAVLCPTTWTGQNQNMANSSNVIGRSGVVYTPDIFKGNISNVKIYNRALTTSEIQQNFNATKSRFGM